MFLLARGKYNASFGKTRGKPSPLLFLLSGSIQDVHYITVNLFLYQSASFCNLILSFTCVFESNQHGIHTLIGFPFLLNIDHVYRSGKNDSLLIAFIFLSSWLEIFCLLKARKSTFCVNLLFPDRLGQFNCFPPMWSLSRWCNSIVLHEEK